MKLPIWFRFKCGVTDMLLPNFEPAFNFEESQCAYIGDSTGPIRVMVDFAPIGREFTTAIFLMTNTCVLNVWGV